MPISSTEPRDLIAGSATLSFSKIRSSFSRLFRHMEGPKSPIKNFQIDNSFVFYSGLDFSYLNQATIYDKSDETFEKIMTVVSSWNLPNQISLGGAGLKHAEQLQKRGYVFNGAVPFMLLELDSRFNDFELRSGLSAVRTLDEPQIKLNVEMISSTFGISEEVVKSYTSTLNEDSNTFRYILYSDGVPVSSCCFVKDGDFLGCFDVVTPSEHQRKGYGEELMKFMLKEQFENGGKLMALQSSAAGEPLYIRLGFKLLEYHQTWVLES